MQLSVNYSPQAADLYRTGAIALDRWKCFDWPELITGARATGLPYYVHFDLHAGPGSTDVGDLERIAGTRADSETPYVNVHVAVRQADFPDVPVESNDPAHVDAVLAQTARDIGALTARFGPEAVIAENLTYRGPATGRLRLGQEAAFLRHLCEETGCGFLLDIAHARVAAHYLGLDERAYLASLPVDRLREIHVSGPLRTETGEMRDGHLALGDDDWSLLGWCLGQIQHGRWARPWLLALEYGGIGPRAEWRSEAAVLAAQLPRLHALVHDLLPDDREMP